MLLNLGLPSLARWSMMVKTFFLNPPAACLTPLTALSPTSACIHWAWAACSKALVPLNCCWPLLAMISHTTLDATSMNSKINLGKILSFLQTSLNETFKNCSTNTFWGVYVFIITTGIGYLGFTHCVAFCQQSRRYQGLGVGLWRFNNEAWIACFFVLIQCYSFRVYTGSPHIYMVPDPSWKWDFHSLIWLSLMSLTHILDALDSKVEWWVASRAWSRSQPWVCINWSTIAKFTPVATTVCVVALNVASDFPSRLQKPANLTATVYLIIDNQ